MWGRLRRWFWILRGEATLPSPSSSEEQLWRWCPPSNTWACTLPTILWGHQPIKKAHQRLYFLRRLRWAGLSPAVLTSFYRCVVESTSSITVWYGNCSAVDRKGLVVKSAQKKNHQQQPPFLGGHLCQQVQNRTSPILKVCFLHCALLQLHVAIDALYAAWLLLFF